MMWYIPPVISHNSTGKKNHTPPPTTKMHRSVLFPPSNFSTKPHQIGKYKVPVNRPVVCGQGAIIFICNGENGQNERPIYLYVRDTFMAQSVLYSNTVTPPTTPEVDGSWVQNEQHSCPSDSFFLFLSMGFFFILRIFWWSIRKLALFLTSRGRGKLL